MTISEQTKSDEPRTRARTSGARGARWLVIPIVAVALGMLLYAREPGAASPAVVPAVQQVSLVQKDRHWNLIPPSRGGAVGSVWYRTRGKAFSFQLRAAGLVPRERYVLELLVDSTDCATTRRPADAHGELALDTAITEFAAGECISPAHVAPYAVRGTHDIGFRIRRDCIPPASAEPRTARPTAFTPAQPCLASRDVGAPDAPLEGGGAQFVGG